MFLVQAAFVLAPVCAVAWLILDIRQKNYWGLLFGVLSIALAGFVIWGGHQHGMFYEHDRVFDITDSATRALQAGETESVIHALQEFQVHRFDDSEFYQHRNKLHLKLDALTNLRVPSSELRGG